jgi:tmRNA-binding protein
MMKEFRKYSKKMKKSGFELVRMNGHATFSRDGINITVGKGVKNAHKQWEQSLTDWKNAKARLVGQA